MKKSLKTALIMIGVGILLVLLGLRSIALAAMGEKTHATVTEVKKAISQNDDPLDHNYQVSYRFSVDGKAYEGSLTRKKVYNTAKLPSVGASIPIRYIAKAPSINGGSDTSPLGGIVLGVLGVLLLFLGVKSARKPTPLADQEPNNADPQS